ncbi:MAG: Glucose-1-phosphate adenylyltransferase [uncultured Acidimicrobiales bacterium]|uniref:Glucose-1-phosphate adenylyltransferase n=1 Tax=uncultured Acidimicrobiales bacterium TaxID=310071 RepID=A0A6J4H878_9ACTN|nr:MAG: Glucose-1-phosphate adenylyltransferase [uncultured Acidimicrobiales bacterium]
MRPSTLAIVLAGGAGGRLDLLTEHRAKPAVPFGGTHRLVDVALSCCSHAGISDVWLSEQHNPASLSDHLANGRPWDLDRTSGGLLVVHPAKGTEREGWHQGTADGLWRLAPLIRELAPDVLLLASADAIYRMDYDGLVGAHLDGGVAATFVTAEVPEGEEASRFGVAQTSGGRITGYAYKPEDPEGSLITTEVFAFTPTPLLDCLEALAAEVGEDGLEDIGHGVLPSLVGSGEAQDLRHGGYWRDVGTVPSYWRGHQELLGDEPAFRLDDPELPLLTKVQRTGPARLRRTAEVDDSLLAPGSDVAGRVERSVLSGGVVVEEGAVVRESVLLPGVVVRRGAVVERAVLDDGAVVAPEVRVGGPGDIALVGRGEEVTSDLPAGGRLPAPED